MATGDPPHRKPRSFHRSIMAAHRNAAHDARSLIVDSRLLHRIANLRQILQPLRPKICRAWREGVGRLRGSAENTKNLVLTERLRRLELHELAARNDDDGLTLRKHVLETAWSLIRDDAEEGLCQITEQLPSDFNLMHADFEDVVDGHNRLNQNAEDLTENGVFELHDLRELAALNCTIGAHVDQARSVLKIGEWLLEAITQSRHEACPSKCTDRRAWCCFFAQRALAVLATSNGTWVGRLIDEPNAPVATQAASASVGDAQTQVTTTAAANMVNAAAGTVQDRSSPERGRHPLESHIQIAKDDRIANHVLNALFAEPGWELSGAELVKRKITRTSDEVEAVRSARKAIVRAYPAAAGYIRTRTGGTLGPAIYLTAASST